MRTTIRLEDELIGKLRILHKGDNFSAIIKSLIEKELSRDKYSKLDDACPRLNYLEDGFWYCLDVEGKKRKLGKSFENADACCKVCDYLAETKKMFKEWDEIRTKSFTVEYVVCNHPKSELSKEEPNMIKCPFVNHGRTFFNMNKCLHAHADGSPCKNAQVRKFEAEGIK